MDKFWIATRFALNVYIISTFIVLVVLGLINILNKVLHKKEN
jgi:hypothetical protein